MCVFIVGFYAKAWFTAADPVAAPRNDIAFIKVLIDYKLVDFSAATVALRKFSHHMWYLSEKLVGLSFFDDSVSASEKREMVASLFSNEGLPDPPNRLD